MSNPCDTCVFFTYLRRELRRRSKQAIVVAIGLAIGIGLVVTVSATSAGVKTAQGAVLHSLYGVGTDITVTKTATPGNGGRLHFGGFGNAGSGSTTAAGRPAAGTHISRNSLSPTPGEGTLPAGDVTKIAHLHGTAAASGGLVLTDTSFTGTIPSFSRTGTGPAATAGSGSGPSFNVSSFTVEGIQLSGSGVGPLNASQVSRGRYFPSGEGDADVAVVSSSYAKTDKLAVGSKLTVAGTSVKVVGIANLSSGATDVFIPLGTAQTLSKEAGKVTDVFVSATSSSSVSSLAAEVKAALPKATVATSSSLADDVSGSISSAANLAGNLGKWLSIAALAVAFLLAGLLMMAAVSRRVREFGTLKAIGWRTRRVVGQVMGEGLAMGIIGGIVGIVLGVAGAEIVSAVSPTLTATVGSPLTSGGGFPGGGFGGGGGFPATRGTGAFGGGAAGHGFAHRANAFSAAHTALVHLTAPLQGGTIGLAVGLAVAGGLVAGAFGAWRAARLRPAAALRRVE